MGIGHPAGNGDAEPRFGRGDGQDIPRGDHRVDAPVLSPVPSERVDELTPLLMPAFQLMADKSLGCFHAVDFIDAIRRQDMQLWLAHVGVRVEAVLLTEIIKFPRRMVVQEVACVGRDWKRWAHLRRTIEEWAMREHGCTLARMIAPRKWLHANPDMREWHVIAVKELA